MLIRDPGSHRAGDKSHGEARMGEDDPGMRKGENFPQVFNTFVKGHHPGKVVQTKCNTLHYSQCK